MNLGKKRVRRHVIVGIACGMVLVGLGLARSGMSLAGVAPLFVALFLAVSLRRQRGLAVVLAVMLGLSLGLWRGGVYQHELMKYAPLYDKKVTIVGKATADAVYGTNGQLATTLGDVRLESAAHERLVGTISISGFGAPMIYRGDTVRVSGKLRTTLGANRGRMSYATLNVLSHNPSWIDTLRRKFAAGMQSALPEPLASFGMGLLIGQRSTLPEAVSHQLLMVGLVHIIAVSGYNLTIILRLVRRLLGGRSKFQSTVLFLVLIGVFLLLTGSSPSIVRAAVVSVIGIAVWYYGRKLRSLTLILLAAAITAMLNPISLWFDAGWWLSFLAFYGVLVLAPLVAKSLFKKQPSVLAQIALESLCAEIMTVPFVLHTFGQMSFVALVANVLVAVFVPFAMLLSLIAGLAGMLVPAVCGWFAWPARLLLTYMLDAANILSQIPHVFAQNLGFSLAAMLGSYAAVAVLVLAVWKRNREKRAIITDDIF